MQGFVEIFILRLGSTAIDYCFSFNQAQRDEFASLENSISVENVIMFDDLCIASRYGPKQQFECGQQWAGTSVFVVSSLLIKEILL